MIKAIETSYAGCRFRSRLEARWAVFFDHLGINWQYEPQGYVCTHRLTGWLEGDDPGFPYLPDFWFPDLSLHGEVKGALTDPEVTRLLNAAASLSSNDGGGCHDSGGHDLIVFGNIPSYNQELRTPVRLHMHKGNLDASGWTGDMNGCAGGEPIAGDFGGFIWSPENITKLLTGGAPAWAAPSELMRWLDAYTAARSARFEHGQSGA